MKRKRTSTGDGKLPDELRAFELDDWIDRSEPIPESWNRPGETYSYHLFRARRRWIDARREWAAANGTSVLQILMDERPPRPTGG
ncbi:hypothetical protein GCM10022221_18180 [Actinocorallia aurea]